MSRLKLAANTSLKQLGHAVFNAAGAFYSQNGQPDPAQQTAIAACLDLGGKQFNLHFHYDRTTVDPATGQTISDIHVVIPEFSGKVRDPLKMLEEFDLSDIAAESMGFVVIMGCGD